MLGNEWTNSYYFQFGYIESFDNQSSLLKNLSFNLQFGNLTYPKFVASSSNSDKFSKLIKNRHVLKSANSNYVIC